MALLAHLDKSSDTLHHASLMPSAYPCPSTAFPSTCCRLDASVRSRGSLHSFFTGRSEAVQSPDQDAVSGTMQSS